MKSKKAKKSFTNHWTQPWKEEKSMSDIQKSICRNILDAAEVTKSQVTSELIQGLSTKLTQNEIKELVRRVSGTVDIQTNQLVDRVIKTVQ